MLCNIQYFIQLTVNQNRHTHNALLCFDCKIAILMRHNGTLHVHCLSCLDIKFAVYKVNTTL